MKINMKMASLLALIGTGIVILCSIAHPLWSYLFSFLHGSFGFPFVIMGLVSFLIEVVKIIGLALMGLFFFAFWRNQE